MLGKTAKVIHIVIAMGVLCLAATQAFAQEGWVKAKEKKGVVVFTRISEGSKIKEFKAKTEIETSLSSLVAVLSDLSSFPKWYKNAGEAKVLKRIDDRSQIYYYEVLVPFPFKNRHMVQRIEFKQDLSTKSVTATISNMPDYEIEANGRVRMPMAEGSWTLTPLGDNRVSVEHQYLADPSGNIPKSIVNMLIVGGPYRSLIKLKNFVQKDKYQNAHYDWLK